MWNTAQIEIPVDLVVPPVTIHLTDILIHVTRPKRYTQNVGVKWGK